MLKMISSGDCKSDGCPGSGGVCFLAMMTRWFSRVPRRTALTRALKMDVSGGVMVRDGRLVHNH